MKGGQPIMPFLPITLDEMQEYGWERMDAAFLGEIVAAGINLLITVPMNFLINKQ